MRSAIAIRPDRTRHARPRAKDCSARPPKDSWNCRGRPRRAFQAAPAAVPSSTRRPVDPACRLTAAITAHPLGSIGRQFVPPSSNSPNPSTQPNHASGNCAKASLWEGVSALVTQLQRRTHMVYPRPMKLRMWLGRIVASYKFTSPGNAAISTATLATSEASMM